MNIKKFRLILLMLMLNAINSSGRSVIRIIRNTIRQNVNLTVKHAIPDPLRCNDGTVVESIKTWENKRRPELLEMFSTYMYGKVPNIGSDPKWEIMKVDDNALDGRAIRKDVRIWPCGQMIDYYVDVQIYLPQKSKSNPVPVFISLSFQPNFTVYNDPHVIKPSRIYRANDGSVIQYSKGEKAGFWNLDMMLERGYGLATFWQLDLINDTKQGFEKGFPSKFFKTGQHVPYPYEWGTISLWAWQMSRVVDYLVKDDNVDKSGLIAIGHSRLGKAAIWAAAQDTRFAMVISNNSGCGGAALLKRCYGETVTKINRSFPQWFCGNFKQFNDREEYLPFDQHELIALIAPRPVYIASAEEDNWSDPYGEFLGGKEATCVYHLYGLKGLETDRFPAVESPIHDGYIGYHIRKGKHDMTSYDVEQYLDFADQHLRRNTRK